MRQKDAHAGLLAAIRQPEKYEGYHLQGFLGVSQARRYQSWAERMRRNRTLPPDVKEYSVLNTQQPGGITAAFIGGFTLLSLKACFKQSITP